MIINADFVIPYMREKLEQNNFSRRIEKSLGFEIYENGIILPFEKKYGIGGVTDKDGKFIDNSAVHEGLCNKTFVFRSRDIQYNDEDAIFLGSLHYIFGHAITDNLKKIWFLRTPECKSILEHGGKIIYITINNNPLPDFVFNILKLAGVETSLIKSINKRTQFKNVIIPENSIQYIESKGRFYFQEYYETIELIKINCTNIPTKTYQKVYFSRTALNQKGRDFGEKKLELYFKKHGYTIIYPEKIPLEQQINIAANCGCLAATESSASHHAVFCKPNTKMILLQKSNYVNTYSLMVNDVSGVEAIYVTAHQTITKKYPWMGPFYMNVTKYVGALFNEKDHCNRWFDIEWYNYLHSVISTKLQFIKKLLRTQKH